MKASASRKRCIIETPKEKLIPLEKKTSGLTPDSLR